jgi:hypothetical protein
VTKLLEKKLVKYRGTVSPSVNCGKCRHMHDDGTCALVVGLVDRKHVCDLFEKKK